MRIVHIERPPAEPCGHGRADQVEPPPELVEPRSEKRLIKSLREAASTRDAHEILVRASLHAYASARGLHVGSAPLEPRGLRSSDELALANERMALAMADLAATGAEASRVLLRNGVQGSDIAALAAARVSGIGADDPDLLRQSARMLERAKIVSRYLVQDADGRRALARARPELAGWIGVSGEDDLPALPVNMPFTELTQRTCTVTVREHALRVRYAIAGATDGSAPIVLFLHGHSSRIEENDRVIAELAAMRTPDGGPAFCVVAPDLPGSGYTSHLDHERVAPIDAPGAPMLEFLEEFIDAFVGVITAELGVPKKVACIAGGSMGGNLVLRFAERGPAWIERFAAWSPASVWSSLTGDLIKGLGVTRTRENSCASESELSRRAYFKEVFATRICLTTRTQPEMWYRDGFLCRARHINRAMWDRREIYGAAYRRWHWRLAHEQLVFSHVQRVDGVAPWQRIQGPVLLVAGAHDNFSWTHIYERTRDLGRFLAERDVPGTCLLLNETGHSIHDERPRLLARAIAHFIERHPR